MRRTRPVALLLLSLFSACYRYVPATTAALAPGADVRLALTPAGATELVPILGSETTAVEGRVLGVSDSGYALAVSGTLKRGAGGDGPSASRTVWAGESVTIPRAAVGGVERRSLDRRRTALVGAFGTAAAVATVYIVVRVVGSSGSGRDDGGTVTPP